MDIKITLDNGKQISVGKLNGDMLVCPREEQKHLYRGGCKTIQEARDKGLSAWGLDARVFDDLYFSGLKELKIVTPKKQYVISSDEFKENAKYLHFRPYRPQYICPEKLFIVGERA